MSATASPAQAVRVLIVDRHAILRESLTDLLDRREGITVAGQARDGREALSAVARLAPEVVLLDLDLPDMTGLQATRAILQRSPGTTVLLTSEVTDPAVVAHGLAAGARGYLDRTTGVAAMLHAIHCAAHGVEVFAGGGSRPEVMAQPLSSRELEVITQLARGLTNAEMARQMHLAVKTVERIVATAVDKLGARNRTHAVTRALTLRLLSLRDLDD
jgi:DNA-binding NarL/FixJ family response regulator